MNETKLERVRQEKDSDVCISDDLNWTNNYSEAVDKANTMLGMIKRTFMSRSKEIIIPLYKCLVRPHLEFCCEILNRHYIKDIRLIEEVQRMLLS